MFIHIFYHYYYIKQKKCCLFLAGQRLCLVKLHWIAKIRTDALIYRYNQLKSNVRHSTSDVFVMACPHLSNSTPGIFFIF